MDYKVIEAPSGCWYRARVMRLGWGTAHPAWQWCSTHNSVEEAEAERDFREAVDS